MEGLLGTLRGRSWSLALGRPSLLVLVTAALVLGACGEDGTGAGGIPDDCGLPSPKEDVDESLVPPEFLLGGDAIVRKVSDRKELLIVALNVPLTITQAFERYKEDLGPPKYEVVTEDNEIFEAELYLRDSERQRLVALQMRRPQCEEAISVYVTIDKRD